MLKRFFNLVLVLVLGVFLTACGGSQGPSTAVIERAIALTVETSQQSLAQQLRLEAPRAKDLGVSQVRVEETAVEPIEGGSAYHLKGRYKLTYPQSDRQVTQEDLPFELRLKPQRFGEGGAGGSWQLGRGMAIGLGS
ncbi:MAG: hypothetical protein HC860_00770 [Alkalinema sp. RU_4_3]|nr:hypothetical protein [Alkalinema sp. RU_4_3]